MSEVLHNWLGVLLLAAAVVAFAESAYLIVLAAAAWSHPRKRERDGRFTGERRGRARFVILIPAHNEERMIAETVSALSAMSYPPELREVVVVADNCSDATADRCRHEGCTVLERADPDRRGKGPALDWAMREHLASWPRHFDAVVVVDADSVANPDFLWFVEERLAEGRDLLQGYYAVRNPADSWRTSLLTASLGLFHFLRPLGRDRLGLPCGLKGNGFVMSRRLVLEYGYPAGSNVEDVELSLYLVVRGVGAAFVAGAQVFGEMTTSAKAAAAQRSRWEGGRVALVRSWSARLLREAFRRGDGACLDALVDLLIPPFSLLAAGTGAVGLLSAAWWLGGASAWGGASLALAVASLALQAVYVVCGLWLIRAPAVVWRRMVAAPLYVVWKMLVYCRMLATPQMASSWKRTERNPSKTLEGTEATERDARVPNGWRALPAALGAPPSGEPCDAASEDLIDLWQKEYRGNLSLLGVIRRDLRHALQENSLKPLAEEDLNAVLLCATEACSNIIRHAFADECGGTIRVELSGAGATLVLSLVHDGGPFPQAPEVLDEPDCTREHGYGLYIIQSLMDSIQYSRTRDGLNCVRMAKTVKH